MIGSSDNKPGGVAYETSRLRSQGTHLPQPNVQEI